MSSLVRIARSKGASTLPTRGLAAFHTSSVRRAMGESDRANSHDKESADLTQKRDQHQKDSLDKQKQGKGEWKPELASDSEQAVAGEKSELSMKEMQEMGEKKGERENKR